MIGLGNCGFVVLNGGTGTLPELATVWEFTAKGAMDRRPIVCVGPFWQPVVDVVTSASAKAAEFVRVIKTPAELAGCFRRVSPAG